MTDTLVWTSGAHRCDVTRELATYVSRMAEPVPPEVIIELWTRSSDTLIIDGEGVLEFQSACRQWLRDNALWAP